MGFFNKYPYTDFHELNLDWVLQTVKLIGEKVDNFINFNSIKYADPLAWNITTQYAANTVVIDPATGIAYLSTQPVPNGVLITDTNYWTAIFDMSQFFADLGDINDLLTTDKTSVVNAINEIFTDLENISDTFPFVTPEMFGAVGDGNTDDTDAINNALLSGKYVLFKSGAVYLIDTLVHVKPQSDQIVDLNFCTLKAIPNAADSYRIIKVADAENVTIKNGTLLGDRDDHLALTGESGNGVEIKDSNNITLDNLTIKNCWGDGVYIGSDHGQFSDKVTVTNCHIDRARRNGISVVYASNFAITNNLITNTDGTAPRAGIDIEPDADKFVVGGVVENNTFKNNWRGICTAADSSAENVRDVSINNNVVYVDINAVHGIDYQGMVNSTLHGNLISFEGSASTAQGLLVKECIDCTISENTLCGDGYQILIITDDEHCTFSGNKFIKMTSTTGKFAMITGMKNCVFKDNVIDTCQAGSAGTGNLFSIDNNTDDNIISSNIFRSCTCASVIMLQGNSNRNEFIYNRADAGTNYTFSNYGLTGTDNKAYMNIVTSGGIGNITAAYSPVNNIIDGVLT